MPLTSYQRSDLVCEFLKSIDRNIDSIISPSGRAEKCLLVKTPASDSAGQPLADDSSSLYASMRIQTFPTLSAHTATRQFFPIATLSIDQDSTLLPSASCSRQPWTRAEEDALLAGLACACRPPALVTDSVDARTRWLHQRDFEGPHSSPTQRQSAEFEAAVFADRGRKIPECLQSVTGDLEERCSARAEAALIAEGEAAPSSGRGSCAARLCIVIGLKVDRLYLLDEETSVVLIKRLHLVMITLGCESLLLLRVGMLISPPRATSMRLQSSKQSLPPGLVTLCRAFLGDP